MSDHSNGHDTSLLVSHEIPRKPRYYLASIACWFGSLSAGSCLAYTSPALPELKSGESRLTITDYQGSWLGSIMALTALAGGIFAGVLVEKVGRKNTLLFTSLPFIAGWLAMAYAPTFEILLLGRALTGVCCGVISLVGPIYIAETATASSRGFLGSGFQLSVTVGVLIAYIAGKYQTWSWLAVHLSIYPFVLLCFMCFMPETPSWLISQGRVSEATDALVFLYGNDPSSLSAIQSEQSTVNFDQSSEQSKSIRIADLLQPQIWKPTAIILLIMFFQQFNGINAMIFYMVDIFKSTGSHIDSHDACIIVGTVQVVSTLAACFLSDRAGRKILLIISGTVMCLSLSLMASYYLLRDEYGSSFQHKFGWVPLVALMSDIFAFSIGYGPIAWLLMGEIVPSNVKGLVSSMATTANWICCFLVTKEFNDMTTALGFDGAYLVFAIICAISVLFVACLLPETKGKTLQEIENHFRS